MSKRILISLSEWGYWGEELLGPNYIDPSLGRSVTTPEADGD